ncbi:MAG: PadR family transcriptional regulator [Bacilli bacterium]|nr:PadR family transcriptional regulator [Bacilli bacterium]
MNTQDVILGMLHKRPYSGYKIKHYFEAVFSFFFDASFGTIYPTLRKMEQLGYITKENIPQENRPSTNIYTITEKGKEQFLVYLHSAIEKQPHHSDFLMRLFFGEFVELDVILKWLQEAIEGTEKKLEVLQKDFIQYESKKMLSPTQRICMQIGIEGERANIKVLREGMSNLQKLNKTTEEQGD